MSFCGSMLLHLYAINGSFHPPISNSFSSTTQVGFLALVCYVVVYIYSNVVLCSSVSSVCKKKHLKM